MCVTWAGQEELEQALRELVDASKRRELAAACVALASGGAAVEVHGLEGPLDVLQRWVLGGQVDLGAAADAADTIATREYNDYAARGGSPVSYAAAARATVVLLGCRAARAEQIDLAQLAYNALAAIAGGETPTAEDVARAVDAVHLV